MNTGGDKVTVPKLPWINNGTRPAAVCGACGYRVSHLFFRKLRWLCRRCMTVAT